MERHRRRAGDLFIEIHPEDARTRRVATGDAVRVWNERGEVRAVCSVSDRVRPGVAWMPFGGFMDADGTRRSVNVLTAEEPTDWGGGSGLYDAFVEVAPLLARAEYRRISGVTDTPCTTIEAATTTKVMSASIAGRRPGHAVRQRVGQVVDRTHSPHAEPGNERALRCGQRRATTT